MNEALLAKKGITPSNVEVGSVDEFALRIGERATLVSSAGARSYGVVMNIPSKQVKELYSDKSVADYVPESVIVELLSGNRIEAECYNLPVEMVAGINKVYAEALLEVARKQDLPEYYLVKLKQQSEIKGGCLCGRVRYQISGPLIDADHCHCSMCRRQHGAAFATYAEFNPDDFKWTAGKDHIKVYESPAGGGWCFCRECGSTLAGTDKGRITTVTLGTVEGDPGIKPTSHIFVASKARWHEINDALPQFEERPPATISRTSDPKK